MVWLGISAAYPRGRKEKETGRKRENSHRRSATLSENSRPPEPVPRSDGRNTCQRCPGSPFG